MAAPPLLFCLPLPRLFRVTVANKRSRELRAMRHRKLSPRPRHHAQADGAIEDFKKTSQRAWMKLPAKRRASYRCRA